MTVTMIMTKMLSMIIMIYYYDDDNESEDEDEHDDAKDDIDKMTMLKYTYKSYMSIC